MECNRLDDFRDPLLSTLNLGADFNVEDKVGYSVDTVMT
jgi:hypothetical protein